VQPSGKTIERCYDDLEQVYYILENSGVLIADGEEHPIQEGDMVHVAAGTKYTIANPHAEWLSYMIMAA
jgi:mannose-6-phosphate isomerase-like protein (cupin superfamily)